MRRGAPERINGLWCLISWRTINLPTVLSWLKVKCWNRSMRTPASEIAAAPSAGRRILISSSSFSPAATLDEAVPDMAERAATSQQAWCTRAHTNRKHSEYTNMHTYTHTNIKCIRTHIHTLLWYKRRQRQAKISTHADMNPILYTFSSISDAGCVDRNTDTLNLSLCPNCMAKHTHLLSSLSSSSIVNWQLRVSL